MISQTLRIFQARMCIMFVRRYANKKPNHHYQSQRHRREQNLTSMNSVIIFCAKYLFVLVVICLAVAWLPTDRETKKRFIVATVLAGGIAFALSRIAGHLYYDPRPFVTEHLKPLIPHGADNGFPSDHALLTMALTAITYFFNKKIASLMLVLTIVVGVARILAKVHSPLDIGGGWVFGIIGAVCGYYLMRWAFTKYFKQTDTA